MRRVRVCVLSFAVVVAPSAWAATEVLGASDAMVRDAGSGTSVHDASGARWSVDGDEPFAVDEDSLASAGQAGAAPERNPFTWTLLLIAFAGLTAVFAGKRSGGRGLTGA